jgi:hypothetical protein
MPQKRIGVLSNMERAVRIVYLIDQARKPGGLHILMDIKKATRLFDLVKCAAMRKDRSRSARLL